MSSTKIPLRFSCDFKNMNLSKSGFGTVHIYIFYKLIILFLLNYLKTLKKKWNSNKLHLLRIRLDLANLLANDLKQRHSNDLEHS